MGFEVDPDAVKAAGADLIELGHTVQLVEGLVDDHLRAEPGGTLLSAIADEINSLRDDLLPAYAPGGDAEKLFDGAGSAMWMIGHSYARTDEEQAAAYDAELEKVDAVPDPWTSNGPGVHYSSYVTVTGPPEDAFGDYNQFLDIQDAVDNIVGFEWIGDVLGGLGFWNPMEDFLRDMNGDWGLVGKAVGALESVSTYWGRVASDLDGMVVGINASWKGNAANAATTWIDQLQEALGDHGSNLNSARQRIQAEAMALHNAVQAIGTIMEQIVGLLPDPRHLGQFLTAGLDMMLKGAASKILGLLDLFLVSFRAALAAGFGIVAAFAQLTRFKDTDFPEVPAWSGPA